MIGDYGEIITTLCSPLGHSRFKGRYSVGFTRGEHDTPVYDSICSDNC